MFHLLMTDSGKYTRFYILDLLLSRISEKYTNSCFFFEITCDVWTTEAGHCKREIQDFLLSCLLRPVDDVHEVHSLLWIYVDSLKIEKGDLLQSNWTLFRNLDIAIIWKCTRHVEIAWGHFLPRYSVIYIFHFRFLWFIKDIFSSTQISQYFHLLILIFLIFAIKKMMMSNFKYKRFLCSPTSLLLGFWNLKKIVKWRVLHWKYSLLDGART